MTLFILPSLVALGIKIWLFSVSRLALFRDNPYLAFFLCALFGLNLAELILFIVKNNPQGALPVMMGYYVAAVFSAASYLILTISVVQGSKALTKMLLVLALIMSVLVCIPDIFISGTQSIGYSLTRAPGEHYGWLQAYLILSIATAIGVGFYGVIGHKDKIVQKRSLVVLIGTTPMALMTIAIISVMILDYRLNATIILSLMTSVTLAVLIYAEKRYRMFKFLSYVPYTQENQLRNQISLLVSETIDALFQKGQKVDFKNISARFEFTVINLAIEATDGNKTHAAEILQIGKATLHRKLAKA